MSVKLTLEAEVTERDRALGAPCQRACPAGIDVPHTHRLISAGKFYEALAIYREKVPLPAMLGYVCPASCGSQCRMGEISCGLVGRQALKEVA